MNYIKEIKAFYDWLETNRLSYSSINLWHALLHVNNKASSNGEWVTEFAVAISVLKTKTSLSKSSIERARNQLKQLGRIEFRERSGNQSCVYRLIAFHTDTQSATQSGTHVVTQSVAQSEAINKLNKTKLNSYSFSSENEYAKKSENENSSNPTSDLKTDQKKEKKCSAEKKEEGQDGGDVQNIDGNASNPSPNPATRTSMPPKPAEGFKAKKEKQKIIGYNECVGVWFKFFEKEKGMKPVFFDKDGDILNKVLGYIKERDSKAEWTAERAVLLFTRFLEIAWSMGEWMQNALSLTVLQSKFNQIATYGKQTKSSGLDHPANRADAYDALAQNFGYNQPATTR